MPGARRQEDWLPPPRLADELTRAGRNLAIASLLALAGIVVAIVSGGTPAHLAWIWATCLGLLGVRYTMALRRLSSQATYFRLCRQYVIGQDDLDAASVQLLVRTQQAIGQTVGAQVYRDGMLGDCVSLAMLRDHEWRIAETLRDLTAVSAEAKALGSEAPGPLAAEVATAQRRARDLVRDRMTGCRGRRAAGQGGTGRRPRPPRSCAGPEAGRAESLPPGPAGQSGGGRRGHRDR